MSEKIKVQIKKKQQCSSITIIDEHCREITMYGRRYRVHDNGDIFKWCKGNATRDKRKFKEPYWLKNTSKPNLNGYLKLHFRHEGRLYTYNQSRLIYHCFFPDKLPNIQGGQNKKGGLVLDHINGDKLNNSLNNLRLVTQSQNVMNISYQGKTTSGYKNINKKIDKRGNGSYAWAVHLKTGGKTIQKTFPCKEHDKIPPQHVIDYRDKLVKEHHGEYARGAYSIN